MPTLLDNINDPSDLRKLAVDQLPQLCEEIREYMIDCLSRNPGHLASSLGAIDLIVALHYVYDTPNDKIVFDVGHQAYAHKILTGRKEAFRTMRTEGGISGFPKMSESPYDCFGVGHSSTSISAALGFAEAARLKGESSKSVALIGDGALTGGLAFEGMNNAGASKADLLVILNDNNHSIDDNIGALHEHLLRITTNPRYNDLKTKVWNTLGETRRNAISRWLRSLKSYVVKKTGGDLFESLGFRYFGPINGNDVVRLVEVLTKLKSLKGPRVLHCLTLKGKGYAPAEADPTTWHAPGRFDPKTGERVKTAYAADRYQDVFGSVLCDLASKDERIVAITPAMASGSGLSGFASKYPGRFFDVGIEEEHAVTFSAGLAAGGLKPVCSIYSSFSQRAYDQIIHDVAMQNLPVVFCLDRAGLVGEDGATHNGSFDLAAYRSIPNLTIAVPRDEIELKNMLYTALKADTPYIIRYPRGIGEGAPWAEAPYMEIKSPEILLKGSTKAALLCLGPVCSAALEAAKRLKEPPTVINVRYLKPFDASILEGYDRIFTFEDGTLKGGLYSEVSERLASKEVKGFGIGDRFIPQASRGQQLKVCGLDPDTIYSAISNN